MLPTQVRTYCSLQQILLWIRWVFAVFLYLPEQFTRLTVKRGSQFWYIDGLMQKNSLKLRPFCLKPSLLCAKCVLIYIIDNTYILMRIIHRTFNGFAGQGHYVHMKLTDKRPGYKAKFMTPYFAFENSCMEFHYYFFENCTFTVSIIAENQQVRYLVAPFSNKVLLKL